MITCLSLGLLIRAFTPMLAQSDTVQVSNRATTYLLFPHPVDLVDIGLPQGYLARIEGHCVFVKAREAGTAPTTLLVKNGDYYFTAHLQFSASPKQGLYDYRGGFSQNVKDQKSPAIYLASDAKVARRLAQIRHSGGRALRQTKLKGVSLSLLGLWNDESATYLLLELKNASSIPYRIDYIGFERIEKKGRRFSANNTANQVTVPLVAIAPTQVTVGQMDTLRYALPLYAFGSRGKMIIKAQEMNGSRTLQLAISGRRLNQAPTIDLSKQ